MLFSKGEMTLTIVLLVVVFSFSQNGVAQTNVSGDVWGTWTVGGSPYYVSGDATVPPDSTLIIDSGVEVIFTSTYTFTVDGVLKALGEAGNMITFRGIGGAAGSWEKIFFSESATAGCSLDYCVIRDGGFDNMGTIYILNNDTSVTVSNCEVHNGASHGMYIKSYIYTGGGDNITKKCNPTIVNNSIHDNGKEGIYVYAYYKNTFWKGNYNTSIASPAIKRNVIYANASGIECYTYANGSDPTYWYEDVNPTVQANPKIQQNTIYGNARDGIQCNKIQVERWSGIIVIETNPLITSNIICTPDTNGCGLNANGHVSCENVKYNNFWAPDTSKNFSGIGCGLGELVQTNLKGDSCDIMYNIFFNPKFGDESNNDFCLRSTSKCIDAGDPSCPWGADGSFPDIGALPPCDEYECIVTISSPTGYDTLCVGSQYTITWTAQNCRSGQFQIQYSTDSGGSWIDIGTTSDSFYNWTVPNVPWPNNSLVKVCCVAEEPACCCRSETFAICSVPQADFIGTPTSGSAPLDVCFTDLSTCCITLWRWEFGDGGTSTEQHPCHTYLNPGTYTVSLSISNPCNPDRKTRTDYITVIPSDECAPPDLVKPTDFFGRTGDTVCADIVIYGNQNPIDAVGLHVTFDSSILVFDRASSFGMRDACDLTAHWPFFDLVEISPGMIRIGGLDTAAIAPGATGCIARLCFEVLSCQPDDTSYICTQDLTDDLAGWSVPCCGIFTCLPICTRGDVNCDGRITPEDALCTFWRFMLGHWHPGEECECSEQAGDVNCDEDITPGDALCIFWRSILGDWTEECQCPLAKIMTQNQSVDVVVVQSAMGVHGKRVKTPIVVKKPQGLDAFAMQLLYPADLLKFDKVLAASATKDWTALDGVVDAEGSMTIGGFHIESLSSSEPVTIFEVVFTVREGASGRGEFKITGLTDDLAGAGVKTCIFSVKNIPMKFSLAQNYPNPFNPDTEIEFSLPEYAKVTVTVYNLLGQVVEVLVESQLEAGYHVIQWNASNIASGVYFYSLTAGEFSGTKRMVLMK